VTAWHWSFGYLQKAVSVVPIGGRYQTGSLLLANVSDTAYFEYEHILTIDHVSNERIEISLNHILSTTCVAQ
jgi:hypothetical protein